MSGSGYSHEEHVAAGLKASMHNPNVSDNAKDRSARRLREMGASDEAATKTSSKKGPSKASVSHIDDTAEVEAGGDLGGDFLGQKAGAHPDKSSHKAQVHQHRVISGYKATLKNPRVSESAKSNAREQLEALGVSE
ncbi:hypothetical protein D9619_009767 [Psilocybe cf. subviscida]|uniref:Conidiation-specific protein 6 n=1 Tax=Psilocybe cf. subviscida TaxID=2480587 RepID=A0A8H5BLN2_9AGAR|nr:hypothetical protein D9619_009767 [Psilocybe cf. subviscida]